jgi:hypothetical protein
VVLRASSSGGGTEPRHDLGDHHDRVDEQLAQPRSRIEVDGNVTLGFADTAPAEFSVQQARARSS